MTSAGAWRRPSVLFAFAASVIATSSIAILRSELFAGHPDILAWAVTFDLTLTIPLLYYLVVIRTGHARPLMIAPVFVVCTIVAALVLPRGHQQKLHDLRFVIAPLEVIAIVLLIRKLAAMRRRETDSDPLGHIEAAARHVFGSSRVAGFVATEVAIVWYALFGWNRKPVVPDGSRSFTVHQKSGWGSVAASIVVLVVAESIGVHLLVQLWSARAAWIITALDFYAVLWILGDYNALRLRPSIVTERNLQIRYGLRWSLTIDRDQIVKIRATTGEDDWKRPGVLKVAMINDPRLIIELREPVVARGLAGMRKTVHAIAISPDEDVF